MSCEHRRYLTAERTSHSTVAVDVRTKIESQELVSEFESQTRIRIRIRISSICSHFFEECVGYRCQNEQRYTKKYPQQALAVCGSPWRLAEEAPALICCLLYTSDAAD